MYTPIIGAVAMALMIGCAYADESPDRWASADDPVVKHILAVEKMWSDTNCRKADPALAAAFADDFHATSTKGKRYGKQEALSTSDSYDRDCVLGSVKVRFFGDSVAMAYGGESSIRSNEDGTEVKRCLAWTDTWFKRNGQWRIIAAQDNIVDCE